MRLRAHVFAVVVATAVLLIGAPSSATDTTPLLATLRQHSAEFERCFDEFEPAVPSRVTIAFVINGDGYGVSARIVEGRAGLDSPGLCLVDHFMLQPGVRFDDPRLRGQRFRATFAFSPNASPRLDIAAR
jgi:hypothetical protein